MGKYTDYKLRNLTEYNKRFSSLCIYCHNKIAESKEHVPSRVFLDEPYPDEFDIAPACIKCNNAFSFDELYLACFVDKTRNVFSNNTIPLRQKTIKALNHDKKLSSLLDADIIIKDGKFSIKYDLEAIERILIKLAKGHMCCINDKICSDDTSINCNFKLIFDLNDSERKAYEEVPIVNIVDECGSNFTHNLLIIKRIGQKSEIISSWNNIQDGNYRYLSYFIDNRFIFRIVILETLFAEVIFSDI